MAKYTEAQARAINKYRANKKIITLTISPEQYEKIKEAADKNNLSVTQYILRSVDLS